MNPKFVLEGVQVLEFTKRDYTNKKGELASYVQSLVRIDGKVLKFGCNKDVDLTPYVDKKVNLVIELSTWGDDLSPVPRIVGLEK